MNEHPSIPTATYRLQFHKGFTFRDAASLADYLHDLGISHVYASPYFRASPGSLHGYDVADHNELNPEVGSREDFDAFVSELRAREMGQVLDFVPNHMGIAEASNVWWMDVLENGPSSPYSRFFDIDWSPVKRELENSVLLPILGDQYGRVLEKGELKLHFVEGAFWLDYYERRLPIAPKTVRPLLQRALAYLQESGESPPELASIITALEYLPLRTETDQHRIEERAREKEIIKMRLARLCQETPAVEEAIQRVVSELQGGGEEHTFDAFDELISAQPYRLAYWRVAAEEINYRRFFDINNLAAIRIELPEVFEAAHRLVFELIEQRAVTGLRIDHIDGLYHPRAYLEALQQRYSRSFDRGSESRPLYLLVEKILGESEHLRSHWPVHGTTGYEFANQVTSVLIDPDAEAEFTELYAKFIGRERAYPEIVYRSKLLTMRAALASEVNVLGHMLNRLSETNRWYRDFTLNALTAAVREVIACFPVYRTYLEPGVPPSEEDIQIIQRAIRTARRRNPAIERTVFEFVRDVLLPPADNPHPVDEEARMRFVLKFQQCTGPITAKGVEDTAFYVFNRLVALNEVGGEPGIFGATVAKFHEQNLARANEFPGCLLASSTHDTKRSEDVRARIAALSEMPEEWGQIVRRWQVLNRRHRRDIDGQLAPDPNEEYLLYQTLVGSWPLAPMSRDERENYVERIQAYMIKALHEAKVNSSWIEPNEPWDSAVSAFVKDILSLRGATRFQKSFQPFAEQIAAIGAINSLSQTVLKLTCPGVPDIYQGNETWDFSLVDPDNRRPVDYQRRREMLADIAGAEPRALLDEWRDGRIKLFITRKLLHFRRENPELFKSGKYSSLNLEGEHANSGIAFHRVHGERDLVVVVPRLSSHVGTPPIGDAWQSTKLSFESKLTWRDLFTGRTLKAGATPLLADILREFPVAVLVNA